MYSKEKKQKLERTNNNYIVTCHRDSIQRTREAVASYREEKKQERSQESERELHCA